MIEEAEKHLALQNLGGSRGLFDRQLASSGFGVPSSWVCSCCTMVPPGGPLWNNRCSGCFPIVEFPTDGNVLIAFFPVVYCWLVYPHKLKEQTLALPSLLLSL